MSATTTSTDNANVEVMRLVTIIHDDLQALFQGRPISAFALTAPRRRSAQTGALATAIASQLFPDDVHEPLHRGALIQYERTIVQLRAAYIYQEESDKERAIKEKTFEYVAKSD